MRRGCLVVTLMPPALYPFLWFTLNYIVLRDIASQTFPSYYRGVQVVPQGRFDGHEDRHDSSGDFLDDGPEKGHRLTSSLRLSDSPTRAGNLAVALTRPVRRPANTGPGRGWDVYFR
jgi:hypothetical protein